MNQFFKKSAALALTVVLLTTGCSSKQAVPDESSSEISESVGSETSTDSSSSGSDETSDDSSLGTVSGSISSSDGESSPNDTQSSASGPSSDPEPSDISGNSNSVGAINNDSGSNNGSSGNNSGNSGNNGSGTIQTTNKPSGGSVTSGFDFSWGADNSWEESGSKCGSINLDVTNNSGKAVSSWKITFTVPNGFKITNGWSGTYSVNGTTVTVTNAEYNGDIPAGGSINIGFIYSSPTAFTPPSSVTFNGTAGSSSGNNGNNQGNNNGNQNNNNNSNQGGDKNQNDPVPSEDILQLLERTDKAVQGDDWLHTDGNKILDKNGKQVWLTGVNWFGYNTGTNTFDGLWNSQMRGTVKAIADHGFNLIRVPISAELLNQWSRGE